LKVTGALAVVVGIFYAEEDWAGWRAWQACRQHWEAQGEHLDWAYYIPPPVPDEQNFAVTEVVLRNFYHQPASATEGQRVKPPSGEEPVMLDIYRAGVLLPGWEKGLMPFPLHPSPPSEITTASHPKKTNTEDYRQPDLGCWMQGRKTDMAAWQFYYQLPQDTNSPFTPHTNQYAVPAIPGPPARDVLFALEKYSGLIRELEQAAKRPKARFPLDYSLPVRTGWPELDRLSAMEQILSLRTSAELAAGETGQAAGELNLMFRLANSVQDEPFSYVQNFRGRGYALLLQPVWEGLARHQWSAAQLTEIENQLAHFDALQAYTLSVRSRCASDLTTIEQMRRCYAARRLVTNMGEEEEETLWIPTILFMLWPEGWFYQNERNFTEGYHAYLPTATEQSRQMLSPATCARIRQTYESYRTYPGSPDRWLMGPMFSPFFADDIRLWAYTQASVDLARIACALERYCQDHGNYPDNLAALSPQYLNAIPQDIITGEPLHYQRTTDGRFRLYSVGWDEKDDGGIPAQPLSAVRLGHEKDLQGDWVWCYPPQSAGK
jgi:hypothetical protein